MVRHIGQILARVAAIVGTRQQIDREDLASPPDANVELSVWYTENLAGAVEAQSAGAGAAGVSRDAVRASGARALPRSGHACFVPMWMI